MPNRFTPLSSKAKLPAIVQKVNSNFRQLDAEANSKTIMAGGGKNAMLSGSAGHYEGKGKRRHAGHKDFSRPDRVRDRASDRWLGCVVRGA